MTYADQENGRLHEREDVDYARSVTIDDVTQDPSTPGKAESEGADDIAALLSLRDALLERIDSLTKANDRLCEENSRLARGETETFEFDAFIVYRSADAALAAAWVRRNLVNYRLPKSIDPAGERALSVFMDRMFRVARNDFDEFLRATLRRSKWILVLASRKALESSSFVHKEILFFVQELSRPNVIVLWLDGRLDEPLPGNLHVSFPNIDRVNITGYRWRAYLRRRWPPSPRLELRSVTATLLGITDPQQLEQVLEEERQVLRHERQRILGWLATAALCLAIVGALLFPKLRAARDSANSAGARHLFDEGTSEADVIKVMGALKQAPADDPLVSTYANAAIHLFAELPPLRIRLETEGVRYWEMSAAHDRFLIQTDTGKIQLFAVDFSHPSRGLSARLLATLASGDPERQSKPHLSLDGHWALLCSADKAQQTLMTIWATAVPLPPALEKVKCSGSEKFDATSTLVCTTSLEGCEEPRTRLEGTGWTTDVANTPGQQEMANFYAELASPKTAHIDIERTGWLSLSRTSAPIVSGDGLADDTQGYTMARFAGNGQWAAALVTDGSIHFWDVQKRQIIGKVKLDAQVTCGVRYEQQCFLAVSPDGGHVAFASAHLLRRWDTKQWHEERAELEDLPAGLAFSGEDSALLVGTRKESTDGNDPPGSYLLAIARWQPRGSLVRGTPAVLTGGPETFVVGGEERAYMIASYDAEQLCVLSEGSSDWLRFRVDSGPFHHLVAGILSQPENWKLTALSPGSLTLGDRHSPIELKFAGGTVTMTQAGQALTIPRLENNDYVPQAFGEGGPFLARQGAVLADSLHVFNLLTGKWVEQIPREGAIAFEFSADSTWLHSLSSGAGISNWFVAQHYSQKPDWVAELKRFATQSPPVAGRDMGSGMLTASDYDELVKILTKATASGDAGAQFVLRQIVPGP